jgi:hypothetical protein
MQRQIDDDVLDSLRHVLLKARRPGVGTEDAYEKAYDFWLEMWRNAFAQVNPEILLQSDRFVTQREVSAIFLKDEVIGLAMYDFRDLRLKAHRDLSYFQHYPAEALNLLRDQGHEQVMILGQMTVHPEWRRARVGSFMTDLLAGIAVKRFLDSAAPGMLAITRNDRSMHELGYRFGAVPLCRGHEAYGIPSDVVVVHRERALESNLPGLAELIQRVWQRTSVARQFSDLPPSLELRAEEIVIHDSSEDPR